MLADKAKSVSPRMLRISTRPVLPEHFAEQVLDFETELDLDCNIPAIQKLIELYSSAIEHYESGLDPKYLHYQERLHSLLARKDVITILNIGSPTSVAKLGPGEILKKMQDSMNSRQHLRALQVQHYMTSCLPETRMVENLIKKHNSDNNLGRARAIENIRTQESPELDQRVEARRRRSGTPNTSFNGSFNRMMSLNSASRMAKMEKYQGIIEEIVEKCVEEKEARVKEAKKRFKEEVRRIKADENQPEEVERAVREVKERLKAEVKDIEFAIREKKAAMIEEAKASY